MLWFPACVVGLGWVGCLVLGIGDTPAAAWLVVVGALAVWWGWHAVGVLG